jgi:hypothetical protein
MARIDLSSLNAMIDQSAIDASLWPRIHTQLNRAVKGNGVNMTVMDMWTGARSKAFFTGYERLDEIAAQMSRVLYEDPWTEKMSESAAALLPGVSVILQGARQIDPVDMRRTPYFNEVCSIGKANDHLTLAARPGGRWSFGLSVNCGPKHFFEPADHVVLAQVQARVVAAITLSARLSLYSTAGFLSDGLITGLDLPVIATRSGRLGHANDPGAALVADGALIRMVNGRVKFRDPFAQAQMGRIEAAAADAQAATGCVRWQAVDSAGDVWLIDAVPLRRPTSGLLASAPDDPMCVMVFTRISGVLSLHRGSLSGVSGMTREDRKLLSIVLDCGLIAGAAEDTRLPRWMLTRAVRRAKRQLGAKSLRELLDLVPALGVVTARRDND